MMNLLASSPLEHAANVAVIVAVIALLRVEFMETQFLKALSTVTTNDEEHHHHHHHHHTHHHHHNEHDDIFTMIEARPELLNWVLHFCLMAVGLELPASLFRNRYSQTPRTIAMGIIFVFFWFHGVLTVLEHSVVNPVLSEKLYSFGVRGLMHFSVYMVSFVMVSPKKGWYVAPAMALLTFTKQVSFKNWYGRILGLASLCSLLYVSDFHLFFKLGFLGIAFLPAMLVSQKLVDTSNDEGHMLVAAVLFLCSAVMVLGLRLKESNASKLAEKKKASFVE